MRLFIAIELSSEIRDALSKAVEELRGNCQGVKWIEPQNIHITLKFLGEVKEESLEGIKDALNCVACGSSPFEASISELGGFPSLKRPRVLWVGLDKGADELTHLTKNLEEALEKIGFPKDERCLSPHITLGRAKRANIWRGQAKTDLGLSPLSQPIRHITLFQSTLTPQGPIYNVLHKAPLGNR